MLGDESKDECAKALQQTRPYLEPILIGSSPLMPHFPVGVDCPEQSDNADNRNHGKHTDDGKVR